MSEFSLAGWRLERRIEQNRYARPIGLAAATVGAILVCGVLFMTAGANPLTAFATLIKGSFYYAPASLAFEVARLLEQDAGVVPVRLFASGRRAPSRRRSGRRCGSVGSPVTWLARTRCATRVVPHRLPLP